MSKWHAEQLIELIRLRYPEWEGFDHAPFVVDEIAPKQKLVEKARRFLAAEPIDALVNQGDFDQIIDSLEKLTRQTHLLWRRVPKEGDTAVFYQQHLDKSHFAIQIRNLLHGDRPSPERLQSFADYLDTNELPVSWPLPTFLLFVTHPQTELLVRARPGAWLLKFMGQANSLPKVPDRETYAQLLGLAHQLRDALAPFNPTSMLDIQSAIWIGMRESKNQIGSLDKKSQVFLDVPPTTPLQSRAYQPDESALAFLEQPHKIYSARATSYTAEDMATETGVDALQIERWRQALSRKGQLVFYGPPGTGKTFVAQRFARLLADQDGFFELIQFHPAYSYEDFIEGLRPSVTTDGQTRFERIPGRFLSFCQRAERYGGSCVLILDEVNRANLTAVFGELMFLLEYRNQTIPLASGTPFHIPKNVMILATMNSADRSLALVDFALRRRFSFVSLQPNYDLLRAFHAAAPIDIEPLIAFLEEINQRIDDPNYAIGHSFFLVSDLNETLQDIWEMDILPYLEEYFLEADHITAGFSWENLKQKL